MSTETKKQMNGSTERTSLVKSVPRVWFEDVENGKMPYEELLTKMSTLPFEPFNPEKEK